jgi:hypothetical protein
MNDRIRQLAEQADWRFSDKITGDELQPILDKRLEEFAQLILANLAEELSDVAQRSKQTNPEWANGLNHASALAQRMTMNLPQWPDAE